MPIESIVLNACLAPEYQCTVRCSGADDKIDKIQKQEWSRKFKTTLPSKSKSYGSHSRSTLKTRGARRPVAAGGAPLVPPIYYEEAPKLKKKDQKRKLGQKKCDHHSEAPTSGFTKTTYGSGSTDSTSSSTLCSSSSSSSYSYTIDQSTLMPLSTIAPSTIMGNNSTTSESFLMKEMAKKVDKNKIANNVVSLVSSSESYGSETLDEEEEIAKRIKNIVSMVMSSDDSCSASGLECALTDTYTEGTLSTGGSKTTKTDGSYTTFDEEATTFDEEATTLGNSTITTRRSLFRWRKSKRNPFEKYDNLTTAKETVSTIPEVFSNNTVKTNGDERTKHSKDKSSSTRKGGLLLGISRSFKRKTSVGDPKPADPKTDNTGQEVKLEETTMAWQF